MKTITFYITLTALLLANLIQAQTKTDSVSEKKPMIIDGKKIRITIDTKDKEHQTKNSKLIYNGDTTIFESEETISKSDDNSEKKVLKEEITVVKKDKKKSKPKDDEKDESRNPSQWFSMDYGFNFLASNGNLDMPDNYKDLELENGKGCNFNLRIYEQSISVIPKHVYFVYGVGIDWNNYRFKNNIDLLKDSNSLAYNINTNIDYKKNKLVSTYLTAPLMIKFKFKQNKKGDALQLAFGPQFGYLLNSHTKQKWETDGETVKQKINGDYNLDEFRIGYSVYLGYNGIDFYARYYPESAFKENKGPVVNTVCLGLSFGGF